MCTVKGKHEIHSFEIECLDFSLYTCFKSIKPQLTSLPRVQPWYSAPAPGGPFSPLAVLVLRETRVRVLTAPYAGPASLGSTATGSARASSRTAVSSGAVSGGP